MNEPAAFRGHLDTLFHVDHHEGIVPLRLAEVTDERVSGAVRQFSLFFHGPGDRLLPQGTYELQHDALGSLALFIVPVTGSTVERIVYQACFSRAVQST